MTGLRLRPAPWPLQLVLRRWQAQWRLQTALLLVAVMAAAALCALVPLVQSTEPAVVRTAIAQLPADRTAVDVQVLRPGDGPEALRQDVGAGLGRLLSSRTPPASTVTALSQPLSTSAAGGALVYAAAVDSPEGIAELTSGSWPRAGTPDAALPLSAARALGLRIGDELPVRSDAGARLTMRVTALYRPRLDAPFWQLDPLRSRGEDPQFTDPGLTFGEPGEAIGPLLGARGAFEGLDLPLLVVDLRFRPDLTAVPVADLRRTASRIGSAEGPVVSAVGAATFGVGVTSEAPEALRGIADGLDASRALVAVSGSLLAALTVAVLLVAGRLLSIARAGEQRVLVERGAGRRHVVGLALAEAVATALLVALIAPLLATVLYRLLVDAPGAAAAGVPAQIGVSASMQALAAAFALVLAVVLTASALRPPAADRGGRASRVGAAARSGVDVAVLVVALVLLQRLLSVPGPPTGAALAAPVLLLIAAALVGLRLVAVVGRLLEPVAARTRSAVVAIAAFELGRRAQRSTAAVLVVALGLGCGAFGLAQLRTWERSQRDQAVSAVGTPARAAGSGSGAASAGRVLAADRTAAYGLRGEGLLTGDAGSGGGLASVGVLALTDATRARLTQTGPAGPAALLRRALATPDAAAEPALPLGTTALQVRIAPSVVTSPRPAGASAAALLRTADGTVIASDPVALGRGAVDLRIALPSGGPLRLSGLRFTLPQVEPAKGVRIRILSVSAGGTALDRPAGWSAVASGGPAGLTPGAPGFADVAGTPSSGEDGGSPTLQLLAWAPATPLPVVLDRAAAREGALSTGEAADLVVDGHRVPVSVAGVVARVPGAAPVGDLLSGAAIARSSVTAVDRERLQRLLVEQGTTVDGLDREWWFAPADTRAAAVAGLGRGVLAIGADQLSTRLQQGPLRVAVRPALLLLVATAALLALVAFAVQAAAARHDRRFDLAQLRAAGATRLELARLDLLVAAVLIGLGALVGLPVGTAIAAWAGPRLVTGPDGGAPVPPVVFDPASTATAVLALTAAAALLTIVLVAALTADRGATARLIRVGGEP